MIGKINLISAKPAVNFGAHYITVDVGASTKNGSLKIKALDEQGKEIAQTKSTVFEQGQKRNEELFETQLATKVAQFKKENNSSIKAADPDDESKVTVCYPGPKIMANEYGGYEGIRLTNFYYDDNREQKFKRPINPDTIDSIMAAKGIQIIDTRHVNDMAATGASVLNTLKAQHPEALQEGREILYLYPGGGLGSGIIMIDNGNIKIKPTEKQHALKIGSLNPRILEKDVASPGLISNFAAALNIDKAVIGENTMVIDNYSEAKKLIPSLTEYEHSEASASAITLYMDSLSQIIARQICDGKTNTVVITGPIANGIKKAVDKNELWDASPDGDGRFVNLMKQMIRENLLDVGQSLMGDDKDFNILVLPNLDNTTHSHILQNGDQVGEPAAWYNIKN